MTVIGGSKARVKTVETFFNKNEMMVSVRLLVKQINATGMYKTNVTFNDIAFISKGRFNATFTNMIADLMLEGNFMHDKHQFNVTRLEMMPTVQNMKFAITGVFKDDTSSECEIAKVKNVDFLIINLSLILVISDQLLNNYINQGWKPVYRELIHEARPLWGDLAVKLMNELFSFIKFEE